MSEANNASERSRKLAIGAWEYLTDAVMRDMDQAGEDIGDAALYKRRRDEAVAAFWFQPEPGRVTVDAEDLRAVLLYLGDAAKDALRPQVKRLGASLA